MQIAVANLALSPRVSAVSSMRNSAGVSVCLENIGSEDLDTWNDL